MKAVFTGIVIQKKRVETCKDLCHKIKELYHNLGSQYHKEELVIFSLETNYNMNLFELNEFC